ncbi:MAG: metallophosphoesterase [Haloarculaceae archaeon]
MQLGIVSDTHDNYAAAEEIASVFAERGIETVLHCGDFISPPLLGAFDGHDFAFHGVLGNNDGEEAGLQSTIDGMGNGSALHGREVTLEFDGTTVHLLHGDQGVDEVTARAESGEYDYVCYGHFHVAEERDVGSTTVLNPGAHFPTVPDENRSVVVLDTESDDVEFVSIDG